MVNTLSATLAAADPEVAAAIGRELDRQQSTLEMIASENFAPAAVMEAQGSVLTNKYAEGYPGRRYYGGCEHVDVIEQLAIDRVKALFGAEAPTCSRTPAPRPTPPRCSRCCDPGDTIMGLNLAHGGHLTHGMKINFSGKLYNVVPYHVARVTTTGSTWPKSSALALEHRPEADRGRLVRLPPAAGLRRVPPDRRPGGRLPHGGHGALRRPGRRRDCTRTRCRTPTSSPPPRTRPSAARAAASSSPSEELRQEDQLAPCSPASRAARWSTSIAAKAVAFKIAASDEFKERQAAPHAGRRQDPRRAPAPADDVAAAGISVVTGGTDVHLVLVDLRNSELDGQQAEDRLHPIGITVNRNAVPFDPRPPMVSSGLRIGTPALATRGFGAAEFTEVADIIATALQAGELADETAGRAARPRQRPGREVPALPAPRRQRPDRPNGAAQ